MSDASDNEIQALKKQVALLETKDVASYTLLEHLTSGWGDDEYRDLAKDCGLSLASINSVFNLEIEEMADPPQGDSE